MTEPMISPAQLLDGKRLAASVQEEVRQAVEGLVASGKRAPGLAIVLVGDDPASHVYVRNKSKTCEKVGIVYYDHSLPATVSGEVLLDLIRQLNADARVDGILVQLPLPGALRAYEAQVIDLIDPCKDVDGFHVDNVGRLQLGTPRFVPCTPQGVMTMLDRAGVSLAGQDVVVIGRSNIVGKPMAALLTARSATVTLCHSRTRALEHKVRQADVVIAAVGVAKLVKGSWLKPGAVVIDVGMNRLPDGKLAGDVDFESAKEVASLLSPVPGGVGPMTIAELMRNCLKARMLAEK